MECVTVNWLTFDTDAQPGSVCLLCIALDVLPDKAVLSFIQDGEKLCSHWRRKQEEKEKCELNLGRIQISH